MLLHCAYALHATYDTMPLQQPTCKHAGCGDQCLASSSVLISQQCTTPGSMGMLASISFTPCRFSLMHKPVSAALVGGQPPTHMAPPCSLAPAYVAVS
jgi:hypothetical protein